MRISSLIYLARPPFQRDDTHRLTFRQLRRAILCSESAAYARPRQNKQYFGVVPINYLPILDY